MYKELNFKMQYEYAIDLYIAYLRKYDWYIHVGKSSYICEKDNRFIEINKVKDDIVFKSGCGRDVGYALSDVLEDKYAYVNDKTNVLVVYFIEKKIIKKLKRK